MLTHLRICVWPEQIQIILLVENQVQLCAFMDDWAVFLSVARQSSNLLDLPWIVSLHSSLKQEVVH